MLAVTVNRELLTRYQDVLTPTTAIGVVLTIGIGGWLVFRLRAWFREGDGRAEDNLEMLTQFRDLRQQGELTEDEYRLIRSHLTRPTVLPATMPKPAQTAADCIDAECIRDAGEISPPGWESRFREESSTVSLDHTRIAQTDLSGMSSDELQTE